MCSSVRNVLLIGMAFLFVVCPAFRGHAISDDEYSAMMIGTWSAIYVYENLREKDYGEKTYCPDGTASGYIVSYKQASGEQYREYERVFFESNWIIENGILITFDIVLHPKPWTGADTIRDRILELTEDRAVFIDLEDGSMFERHKVTTSSWQQRCSGKPIV